MEENETQESSALDRVTTATPGLLAPQNIEELFKFAEITSRSALVPEQYRGKPGDIVVAVQIGAELGVSPMQALANIAVINGRATIWGDLVVAIAERSGQLEYLVEEWDADSDGGTAVVRIKRRGKPEHLETFSMTDAERAGLAKKQTYQQYPQRMCGWRAKSWAIRSQFADFMKGMAIREEVEEYVQVEPGVEVSMPRRRSESTRSQSDMAALDAFIESEGKPAPRASAKPATKRNTAVAGAARNKGTEAVFEGSLSNPSVSAGKPPAKWVLHSYKGSDGETYGTFDTTMAEGIEALLGVHCRLVFKLTDKGNRNIISMDPITEREPGED
ncbi:MAG TPA: hypothetical protein VM285_17455 [Polyangia bacterium]|nr:hypothetical protein [Thermoleophilia bacterium]HUT79487.1 hypothetical protein [Polyangia bacterium]